MIKVYDAGVDAGNDRYTIVIGNSNIAFTCGGHPIDPQRDIQKITLHAADNDLIKGNMEFNDLPDAVKTTLELKIRPDLIRRAT